MEQLLQDATLPRLPQVGDIIEVKVLSVAKNEVFLDVGGIATGVVRGRELVDESGATTDLKSGDVTSATVLEMENERGIMELSFRSAGHQKAWDELIRMQQTGEVIDVPVLDANRGGLMVKVNRIDGFLPVSQLTSEHYPRVEGGDKQRILETLQKFVGQLMRVKVLDVDEANGKLTRGFIFQGHQSRSARSHQEREGGGERRNGESEVGPWLDQDRGTHV